MQGKFGVVALGLVCLCATALWAQPDRNRGPERRWGGPGFRPPAHAPLYEQKVGNGFVFLDGEYVPPPYVVRQEGDQITLNNHEISLAADNGLPGRELAESLESNLCVIAFADRPIVLIHDSRLVELFRILLSPTPEPRAVQPLLDQLPAHSDQEQWRAWLATYELPDNVRATAEKMVRDADAARAEGELAIAANQRLSTWAYPLTVFGMLMSVVSFGHLLQFPPRGNPDLIPSRRRAELCRATVIFLIMVVILSGLDLVWTLLTSQAGRMNELNPIGRELLSDPWMLSMFKVVATFCSCGLLLMLRRHPRAQLASWWMCLICTLLTFRWLVLNSMFVA